MGTAVLCVVVGSTEQLGAKNCHLLFGVASDRCLPLLAGMCFGIQASWVPESLLLLIDCIFLLLFYIRRKKIIRSNRKRKERTGWTN
jgi:hypothetical protein